MKRERSWTYYQYKTLYRWMRRGVAPENIRACTDYPEPIIRAADYSYQAYGYLSTYWISERRMHRFLEIKWRYLTRRSGIPL
jgi:hypothetical protein